MIRGVWVFLFGCMLLACDDSKSRQDTGPVTPPPQEQEDVYEHPAGNLLINPDFESLPNGRLDSWALMQHTGAPSYRVDVENGVASITRINEEPWGVLKQVFRSRATVPLQGKRLRLSAELQADFTDEYGPPFQAAGLNVLLTGIAAGGFGRTILYDHTEPMNLTGLNSPWLRYSIDFDVPDSASASWLELEIAFVMTYGGTLKVRRPFLVEIAEGDDT